MCHFAEVLLATNGSLYSVSAVLAVERTPPKSLSSLSSKSLKNTSTRKESHEFAVIQIHLPRPSRLLERRRRDTRRPLVSQRPRDLPLVQEQTRSRRGDFRDGVRWYRHGQLLHRC